MTDKKTKKPSKKPDNRKVRVRDGIVTHERQSDRITTTFEKTGQNRPTTDNIKELDVDDPLADEEIVRALVFENKPKRAYRRPNERPDPSQASNAEVNLLTKKIGSRVSIDHLELFNRCAEKAESGRQALEKAIELLADELGIDHDNP